MSYEEIGVGVSIGDFAEFHANPVELSELVEIHGTACELRKALACPCARVETGQPRLGCPHCRGFGWTYPEELREVVVVLIHSRQPNRKDRAPGASVDGVIQATFPLGFKPARGDMILPECERVVVQQRLRRALRLVDGPEIRERADGYLAQTPPVRARDERLLYDEGIDVDEVAWIDAPDRPEERLVRGRAGVEYRLAPGGLIEWLTTAGPEPGDGFTVRYHAPAAYLVMASEPVYRSEAGQEFPWKATLTRLDKLAHEDLR